MTGDSARARADIVGDWLGGLIIGALVASGFINLTLNIFYRRGAPLLDAGWFAYLFARTDWRLSDPAAIDRHSFVYVHLMPILELTHAVAQITLLTAPQFFAATLGLAYAVPPLVCWRLLRVRHGMSGAAGFCLAGVIALTFGFSGLPLAMGLYPHPEILLAAGLLMFLVAEAEGLRHFAWPCFAVTLATREDAGLHIFAFMTLRLVSARWLGLGWRDLRRPIGFAGLALVFAMAEIIAQKLVWPGGSPFVSVYLGDPAYAHLSLAVLEERLTELPFLRSYLVLPALVTVAWAILVRRPTILLGYAALLPWTLLHLCAASPYAASFSGYYGFPYLAAMIWPLLALDPSAKRDALRPMLGFALIVLAGTFFPGVPFNPSQAVLPDDLLSPPSRARQANMEAAASAVASSRPLLGGLLVADQLVALAPNGFTPDNTIWHAPPGAKDTVVLNDQGLGHDQLEVAARELPYRRRLRGTPFTVASNRDLEQLPILAALLEP